MVKPRFRLNRFWEPVRGKMNVTPAWSKGNGHDQGDDDESEKLFREGRPDWKTRFAGISVLISALTILVSLFYRYVSSDVERNHADIAALSKTVEELHANIAAMEKQCAIVQDWKPTISNDVSSLLTWRNNCSVKMADVQGYINADRENVGEVKARLTRIEQAIFRQGP